MGNTLRRLQLFSNASDPLVFSYAFLENNLKIYVLLVALAVASVMAVAVASLNNLKVQLLTDVW